MPTMGNTKKGANQLKSKLVSGESTTVVVMKGARRRRRRSRRRRRTRIPARPRGDQQKETPTDHSQNGGCGRSRRSWLMVRCKVAIQVRAGIGGTTY